mmetsp:Transcript_29894/g.95776  ORF Transcript_29894/g.95776 Transcript_29894/m.95776 type:complete len:318 (-) Transcript_29894:81-1034(-)
MALMEIHRLCMISIAFQPSDDVEEGNGDLPDILSSFIIPLAGLSLNDDHEKMDNLANRVQSHMKAISIVHGRDGKTVQTVSEQGPDGKLHTTRSVFDANGNKVTENTPVLSRTVPANPVAPTTVKVDAPKKEAAPAEKPAVHHITKEAAKDAVTSAIDVNAKDVSKLHDENARKEIAKTIADKLGIKESDVQISIDNSGVKVSAAPKKEEPVAVKTAAVKAAPLAESAKAVDPVAASKAPVKESKKEDKVEDVDALEKDFLNEEKEELAVKSREKSTLSEVKRAELEAAAAVAKKQKAADRLKDLYKKMEAATMLIN